MSRLLTSTTAFTGIVAGALLGAALILAACGGGGSSSPTAIPDPVDPMTPVQPEVAFSRANPAGEDLLHHWDRSTPAQDAFGVTTANVPAGAIGMLLNGADATAEDSRALMRNVDPARLETIGEAGGITYGQWRDGPAGTLHIDIDWSQAGHLLTPEQRGDVERGAKAWSYRFTDDFPARTVPAGRNYTWMSFSYDEPVTADDILIVVERVDPQSGATAGGNYFEWSERDGDLEPWFGHIQLSDRAFAELESIGFHWYMHVIVHELGHALVTNPHYDARTGLYPNMGPYNEYLDVENGTFTGPNAMAANGGRPVPYQWLDANRQPVPAGTPGATIDFGHIGACDSIMSYCNDNGVLVKPTALDFAVLQDVGFDLLSASEAAEPEVYGYGAWADYSAWGAGVERVITFHGSATNVTRITDTLSAHVDAFGMEPGTDFAAAHAGMTGSATWNGSLIGVDIGRDMLPPVFGDAAMTVDFATLGGNLGFSNLMTTVEGELNNFRHGNLEYDIVVTANGFTDADGTVHGTFYGPGHEEMAGVLNDRTPGVSLVGAFGGVR